MSLTRMWLAAAFIVAMTAPLHAAWPDLIEVHVGKEILQGKVVAHGEKTVWLMGQDGKLRALAPDEVHKFRKVSSQFTAWPANIVRDKLRREFGKSFDVVGTRHYAVCAVGERKARAYAETFEELFRTFQMYFSVRGFEIDEPEFPLVAIVFPDFDAFNRYATADVVTSKTLKGYYMRTSNRIALYEEPGRPAAQLSPYATPQNLFERSLLARGNAAFHETPFAFAMQEPAWGTIESSLKDTMIHEATHQVAFNTGLHSRIGESPKWVIEGLATVFEAPGIRNSTGSVKTRINHERFVWFGNFVKSRRVPRSLETFLANDDLFKSDVLDAYSQAWALSFFLIETRPRQYAEYLRTIAARNPLYVYPSEKRVDDFQRTVSKELPLLEAEFLRFIAGIK